MKDIFGPSNVFVSLFILFFYIAEISRYDNFPMVLIFPILNDALAPYMSIAMWNLDTWSKKVSYIQIVDFGFPKWGTTVPKGVFSMYWGPSSNFRVFILIIMSPYKKMM